MQNLLNNNGDAALLGMADGTWITYLTSNRMCESIKSALLSNKYILSVFSNEKAIRAFKRDDFTIAELPALSLYETEDKAPSRFYSENGTVYFDIFLPVRLDREDISAVLNTLGKAFKNIIQSVPFWFALNDFLIPLPADTNSQTYKDVLKYKNNFGSPLVEWAKEVHIVSPLKVSLTGIGDAWRLQLVTSYYFDLLNYAAMLEDFGIQAQIDPNLIVYNILKDFSVETKPIYPS